MADTFQNPPMVAYKRPKNIKDYLVKTKLPPPASRPKRKLPGMFKCNKPKCVICPYIKEGSRFKSNFSDKSVVLTQHLTCEEKNCIYLIQCKKCKQQYIGECKDFYFRMKQHLSHARCSRQDKAIGEHFSTNGHSLSDITLTCIEKLPRTDIRYRKTKESIHIEQWNLKYKGLNRKK